MWGDIITISWMSEEVDYRLKHNFSLILSLSLSVAAIILASISHTFNFRIFHKEEDFAAGPASNNFLLNDCRFAQNSSSLCVFSPHHTLLIDADYCMIWHFSNESVEKKRDYFHPIDPVLITYVPT
jgi:hypothetical protein